MSEYKSLCEQLFIVNEITRLRAENEKLRGLLREAHVKMDENKLWVNLRRRIAKAIGEWFYNTETGNE